MVASRLRSYPDHGKRILSGISQRFVFLRRACSRADVQKYLGCHAAVVGGTVCRQIATKRSAEIEIVKDSDALGEMGRDSRIFGDAVSRGPGGNSIQESVSWGK